MRAPRKFENHELSNHPLAEDSGRFVPWNAVTLLKKVFLNTRRGEAYDLQSISRNLDDLQ